MGNEVTLHQSKQLELRILRKGQTTAVIRPALAILHAWAMMSVSIRAGLVATSEDEAVLSTLSI